MSDICHLWYDVHIFTKNIRGVIRKMSNNTVPVLEHIYGEEHKKAECCIEQIYNKTVNGLIYYIFVRKCKCNRHLPSKEFWHKLSRCTYMSRRFCNGFIMEEYCECSDQHIGYTR